MRTGRDHHATPILVAPLLVALLIAAILPVVQLIRPLVKRVVASF